MSATVLVNGVPTHVAEGTTLAGLVCGVLTGHAGGRGAEARDADADVTATTGIAVALGDEVVPRSLWAERPVVDGDRVEIVTAVPGG